MNEHEFRALSAAHALHALSPDEEQVFSAALAAHPEWRTIVENDRETAAAIGEGPEEIVPPASARKALLDAIADAPQHGVVSDARAGAPGSTGLGARPDERAEAQHPRRRRRAGWFALAASLAVLLALSFSPWVRGLLAPQDPVALALAEVESSPDANTASMEFDAGGRASLHWSVAEDRAVFVAEGLPDLDSEHDFELWIVRGDQPISLGVVEAGEDRGAAVIADGFEVGDALAVTIEDRGGSSEGVPTTDPILVVASA